MAYISPFKLGILGSEQSITFVKQGLSINHADIIQTNRNLAGDLRKTIFKVNVPAFTLTGLKLSQNDVNLFWGLKQRNALLNFKYRDDLAVIDEQNTSTDIRNITLVNTSATGITILGVWQLSDPTHGGTNYFTGGSYDPTTRIINCGTYLPGAATDVLINYTYTGNGVIINTLDVTAMQGQIANLYQASMGLQGT